MPSEMFKHIGWKSFKVYYMLSIVSIYSPEDAHHSQKDKLTNFEEINLSLLY